MGNSEGEQGVLVLSKHSQGFLVPSIWAETVVTSGLGPFEGIYKSWWWSIYLGSWFGLNATHPDFIIFDRLRFWFWCTLCILQGELPAACKINVGNWCTAVRICFFAWFSCVGSFSQSPKRCARGTRGTGREWELKSKWKLPVRCPSDFRVETHVLHTYKRACWSWPTGLHQTIATGCLERMTGLQIETEYVWCAWETFWGVFT